MGLGEGGYPVGIEDVEIQAELDTKYLSLQFHLPKERSSSKFARFFFNQNVFKHTVKQTDEF